MIKILGSIKNIKEASIIAKYNFDIIDIKNIEDGALGYVGDEQVKAITSKFNQKTLSVTAGNQVHPNSFSMTNRIQLLDSLGVRYIKIGIFDTDYIKEHKLFLKRIASLNIKKVGVLFADKALDINQIKNVCKLNYDGLMIDTINKSSKCTLDLLDNNLINNFVEVCRKANKFCGISGSMSYENIECAMKFKPDFIGYRGALCSSTNRNDLEGYKCESIIKKMKYANQKMYLKAV